jgi:hypothetical protein
VLLIDAVVAIVLKLKKTPLLCLRNGNMLLSFFGRPSAKLTRQAALLCKHAGVRQCCITQRREKTVLKETRQYTKLLPFAEANLYKFYILFIHQIAISKHYFIAKSKFETHFGKNLSILIGFLLRPDLKKMRR